MASVSSIRFRKRPTPVNSPLGQLRLFLAEDGALKTVNDAGVVAPLGGGTTPTSVVPTNTGNITGIVTLDATSAFQKAALTGNVTLDAPTNGSEGKTLKLWLTASGADRTLNRDAAIKIPSDSGLALPKTLTSGKLYIVLLQHNGTNWMLVSLVGGY